MMRPPETAAVFVRACVCRASAPSLATVADLDGCIITVNVVSADLAAGGQRDFLGVFGVTPSAFTLTGIAPNLGLDPADPLAFPRGLSFSRGLSLMITPITIVGDGKGNGRDVPGGPTVAPLPATAPL